MGDVGGIGSEVTLVALGLEECWCPQSMGCWWHWVGSDIGGIGVGGTLVSPKWGTLVALGLEGRWCPQSGGRWWDWVGSDIGGIGVGSDVGGIGAEGTLVSPT